MIASRSVLIARGRPQAIRKILLCVEGKRHGETDFTRLCETEDLDLVFFLGDDAAITSAAGSEIRGGIEIRRGSATLPVESRFDE